jgi:hypothetical protein
VGYSTNRHCENLVPGPSLGAQGTQKVVPSYTVTANGDTATFVPAGRQNPQGPIGVGGYTELALDINLTALTGTSIQFLVDRQGTDGNWYNIKSTTALAGVGTITMSIGAGFTATDAAPQYFCDHSFGEGLRIRWVGVALTTATFTISLQGK